MWMSSPILFGQSFSSKSFMVDETKWYYTTLPGSMASYGERTQISRVKNHSNLPAYLANWPQYTQENSFQGTIKRQGGPFSRFAQAFSALIVHKKTCLLHTATCMSIMQLCGWTHQWSTYAQLHKSYLLFTLYITHVINYSRPSSAFPYCKQWKAGGNEATVCVHQPFDTVPIFSFLHCKNKSVVLTTELLP